MASKIEGLRRKWDPSTTLTFKARKKEGQKNVLTRMTGKLSVGPFRLLLRSIREHLKVRVWTRSYNHVRGICTGYVIAYDKHFNMALCDVDETYRNPRCLLPNKTATNKRKRNKNKKKKQKAEKPGEKSTPETNESGSGVQQTLRHTESSDQLSETDKSIDNHNKENVVMISQHLQQSEKGTNSAIGLKKEKFPKVYDSKDTGCVISEKIDKVEQSELQLSSKRDDILSEHESELSDFKPDEELTEQEEDLPTDEEALSNLLESLKVELNQLPSTEESGEVSNVTSCDDSDIEHSFKIELGKKITLHNKQDDNSFDSDSSVDGNVSDSSKQKIGPTDLRQKLLKKRLDRSHRSDRRSGERDKSDIKSGKENRKSRYRVENDESSSPRRSRDGCSRDGHSSKSKIDDRSRQSKHHSDRKDQRRKSRERSGDRSSDRSRKRDGSQERKERSRDRKDYWSERRDKVKDIRDKSRESRDRSQDRKTISKKDRDSNRSVDKSKGRPRERSKSKSPYSTRDKSRSRHDNSRSQERRRKSNDRDRSRAERPFKRKDGNVKYQIENEESSLHKGGKFERRTFLGPHDDKVGTEFEIEKEVLCRHVNQLFIRGDNVVMVALVE